jgi:pilus assembly protein Flp/PilA
LHSHDEVHFFVLTRHVFFKAFLPASAGRPSGEVTREYRRPEMKTVLRNVRRFLKSEDGPTAVEYAVMLALIIVVCLVAITAVGTQASTTFSNVANSLGGAS